MKIEFKKVYTFSNFLSLLRIFLAFPIFYLISNFTETEGARYYLLLLYLVVYLTDIGDGYFARKFNQVSELGKIIDPLADKILVIMVVSYLFLYNLIPDYYFYIIILRDVLIFTGGIFVSKKIGKVLPSNYLGKGTVISIGLFIIVVTLGAHPASLIYKILLYLSLVLSFLSVFAYAFRGFNEVKKANNETI